MLTAAPKPVAFARICVGLAAVGVALEAHAHLSRIADGKPAVPVVGWWPNVTDMPLSLLLLAGVLAGLGLALGCCTSWCAGLIVVLQTVTLMTDQQAYSSHRVLTILLCAHLVFAQSDSAWSLRARYFGRREAVPLWPQLLMIGAVSSLYTFAGLSKINDVFLSGHVLRTEMVVNLPDFAYPTLAYLTVVTEVFLGVGVWFARTRLVAVAVGVVLHVSIIATLGHWIPLTAFALLCVGLYPMVLARPMSVGGLVGVPSERNASDRRHATR